MFDDRKRELELEKLEAELTAMRTADVQKKNLEIQKLEREIKILRRPFYQNPSWWIIIPPLCTLGVAITATILTFKSGIFETKQRELTVDLKELRFVKRQLEQDSIRLADKVLAIQDSINDARHQMDSIILKNNGAIARAEKQKDSITNASKAAVADAEKSIAKAKEDYKIAEAKKQTRMELKWETLNFIDSVRRAISTAKQRDDSTRRAYDNAMRGFKPNSREYDSISSLKFHAYHTNEDIVRDDYRIRQFGVARILKAKLYAALPNTKISPIETKCLQMNCHKL